MVKKLHSLGISVTNLLFLWQGRSDQQACQRFPTPPPRPAPPWRVPVSLSRQLHCDCSKIVSIPLGTITRNAVPICFEQEIVAAGMPFKRVMGHNFFYIKMLVKSTNFRKMFIYFAYTIAKNIINYNS